MTIVEQLRKLLPDTEISEDFASKIQAVFTEAVEAKTKEIEDEYKKELSEVVEKANAYAEYVKEETNPENVIGAANDYADYVIDYITDKVDAYCDFIVESFVEENKDLLIETHEYNRMVETLRTIREAFETNYFALSDESPSKKVVRELEETSNAYNELFNKHVELQEQVEKYSQYVEECNRENIFEKLTHDLADTQKDKLKALVEKTQFSTSEDFEEGVRLMIRELHSNTATEEKKVVEEGTKPQTAESNPEVTDSRMKSYLERL